MNAATPFPLVTDVPPAVLDPLRFPLHGSRLIEASAGTGKTFTIAALYLRLVLGHGGDAAFARALTPPEILVVTFTDAATKELRDRIRARLAQAAAYFLAGVAAPEDDASAPEDGAHASFDLDAWLESDQDSDADADLPPGMDFDGYDDFPADARLARVPDPARAGGRAVAGDALLAALRDDYPPETWQGCARKLQLAAEWMDEAAVSTIHGWCHRMLREHAFDSDSLFTQTLETDQSEMLAEVVRDYWRTFLYPLDGGDVAEVLQWWETPDVLCGQLRNLLGHGALLGAGMAPAQALRQARDATTDALAALKAPWTAWIDALRTLFDAAVAAKQVDARKMQRRYYEGWLASLQTWRDTTEQVDPDLSDTAWERLTPDGLAQVCKEGMAVPAHPALDAIAALRGQLANLPDARRDVLCHAAAWVAERFAAEQERRAQMGFDDLLTRLDAALRGPNGARLAELMRQQFPVALIDEFQDTDPLQYRIFDAIYHVAQTSDALALILIGDPKQAIYAFRGADIHTYLSARRDTADRHYTLGRNFRSTRALVAATNHCFLQAERRETGSGAFLFRRADENPLPFLPVAAEGRAARWRVDDADGAALTVWFHDAGEGGNGSGKTTGRGHYVQHFAQVCAGEIVRLLQLGQQGRAGFMTDANVDASADASAGPEADADAEAGAGFDSEVNADAGIDSGALVPVQPGDIAVLVNTGKEAQAVRQALARGGVRSVYLSDKESVFESASAGELQRWLAACAEPDDDRLLRAALGTATLGMGWSELDHLNNDEIAWENRVVQFRDYRTCWRRQGVLPMLRRLLNDFAVPRRLLGAGNDRDLTDLLHLAELLQQASVVLDGEHALIRYLAEQRDAAGDEDDARKLRLESDAALVKVVTVHKSKGLEYPLVFLPFACNFRAVKADDLPLKWHDDAHRPHVALSADAASLAAADRERLGEDLRKLYVALTRARFATWIGVAPLAELERSALGYLLGGGAPIAPGTLAAVLQAFKGRGDSGSGVSAAIDIVPAPRPEPRRYRPAHADMPLARERPLRLPPREPWWIASYSSLQIGAHASLPADAEEGAGNDRRTDPGAAGDPVSTSASAPALDHVSDRDSPLAGDAGSSAFGAGIPATAAQETFAESADRDLPQTDAPAPGGRAEGLHAFPRGPNPGSFLHGLLEWAARTGFAAVRADPRDLDDLIARRCSLRGWTRWIEPLQAWLAHLLDEPLRLGPDIAVRLADLGGGGGGADTYQVEMEFWFGVHAVDTQRLDRLVSRATLGGMSRPALLPNQLNGMLKGFIDLVFEHQGRYYVADYKSNWLGPTDAHYTLDAMRGAILEKRYDLQYVLYLFALHRLLRSRLPDYDYDRHVGGAVYLFLRGSGAGTQGLYCDRPPRALIDALDRLFSAPPAADGAAGGFDSEAGAGMGDGPGTPEDDA